MARGTVNPKTFSCTLYPLISQLGLSAKSPQAQLTKVDDVSTVPPMVRGDWVLFHPVYTQEELKAVEVSK